MARAAKICSTRGCINLMPCELHTPKPWATSTRRTRTVSGGRQQKRSRYVLYRDDYTCCGCGGQATQADHTIPLSEGGDDGVHNMRAICHQCHQAKTQREAQRGRVGGVPT